MLKPETVSMLANSIVLLYTAHAADFTVKLIPYSFYHMVDKKTMTHSPKNTNIKIYFIHIQPVQYSIVSSLLYLNVQQKYKRGDDEFTVLIVR